MKCGGHGASRTYARCIMKRILFAGLLFGFAFAASAQSTSVSASVDSKAQQTTEEKGKASDAFCLRHTGSRIVERQNRKGQRACTSGIGRVYTREELDRTGEIDMADALRKLDTSIN